MLKIISKEVPILESFLVIRYSNCLDPLKTLESPKITWSSNIVTYGWMLLQLAHSKEDSLLEWQIIER